MEKVINVDKLWGSVMLREYEQVTNGNEQFVYSANIWTHSG